jgi:ABC-type polar amino acid transport system ATPase subunit
MIEARGLMKLRGAKRVLDGVDITLDRGQITGVIGPSGGGKTTLLRALLMLDPPDGGSIAVDGASYMFPVSPEAPLQPPWPKITAVFQQLFLWPHLTLRQNILLPLRCLGRGDGEAAIAPLVERFGMAEFLDRYPNQVSGGQQQRAALARAMALNPEYILLDEITSALDVEQAGTLLAHLLELKQTGIGILLITHHLGFLRRAADRVAFIDEGRILETGGVDVLTQPKHERVARFLAASAD